MASDLVYEKCLPILQDETLDEEDRTEKVEELVRQETSLTGKSLENVVLDILWRSRNATTPSLSSTPTRHTVVRKTSPAPWQMSRSGTPHAPSPRLTTASPAPTHTSGIRPSPFRGKSSTFATSPFTSPRPSPRAAFANPQLPRSPSFSSYDYADTVSSPDPSVEFGSDGADWLAADDGLSSASLSSAADGYFTSTGEWVQANTIDMSPYDILRSVIRDEKTDEEIEKTLEANSYDLSAAIMALMDNQGAETSPVTPILPEPEKAYLVGKSMSPRSRPVTPAGQAKSKVPCRYWLATGQCLRADCRFSHDLTNHVCKYWLAGNCLAGDSCVFSHDPSSLMAGLSMATGSPQPESVLPSLQLQDQSSFPSLKPNNGVSASSIEPSLRDLLASNDGPNAPTGLSGRTSLPPEFVPSRPQSRPSSRHQSPGPKRSDLSLDDSEAFPSLGAATVKAPKKHHGKRGGHGHHKDKEAPGSMADVVRLATSPTLSPRKGSKGAVSTGAAANAIPAPEHIPWLETGANANKAYLKARQQAIKHCGARNKFLQSAAQAWHRNDVRAAKALSLRGQSENDLMRDAHREAAHHLFEERNSHANGGASETYVDLHGLHPSEAVSYLASAMSSHRTSSALHRESSSILYAIIGTGHHSKAGRDKIGKAIRTFLQEGHFVFQEFSVPGDRGANGGILGIDVSSGVANKDVQTSTFGTIGSGTTPRFGISSGETATTKSGGLQHGKIRILKAHEDALDL